MLALLALTAAATLQEPVPACTARDLTVTTASRGHGEDGDRHDLLLRNTGRRACTVEPFPAVTLHDARGRRLDATSHGPIGMSPGPAVFPVVLRSGRIAVIGLRWNGDGEASGRRRAVRSIGISLAGRIVHTRIRSAIAPAQDDSLTFEQTAVAFKNYKP